MLETTRSCHDRRTAGHRADRLRAVLSALASGALLLGACATDGDPAAALPTVAATAQVDTVCLTVFSSFLDLENEPPGLLIQDTAQAVLEGVGLEVVAGSLPCDAQLEIVLSFRPLAEQYSQVPMGGGRTCYTGAESAGEATLILPDGQTLRLPLEMRDEPSSAVTECPGPAEAPFDSVWRRPVLQALSEWWGLPALVAAIERGVAGAGGVMADMGSEASPAVPFLMEMLDAADPGAPAEDEGGDFALAAHVIVQISPEAAAQAMPRLTAALEQGERSTRLEVIRSLGDTASPVPPSAIDALAMALSDDPDPYLRAEAARMLGQLGPEAAAAVPALTAALDDRGALMGSDVSTVGEAVAAALGAIGDPGVVPALVTDLGQGGAKARAAIDALAAMGPSAAPAIPALIEALDGEHWASASVALEAITGQYSNDDPSVYLRWWHSLECATSTSAAEVTVAVEGGEVRVAVDQAGPIPASFADPRPCDSFASGCFGGHFPDVTAEGVFFAAHYALGNLTDRAVDLPTNCTWVEDLQQCWWLTDGHTAWPAAGSDVWKPWSASQGSGTASSVGTGDTALRWAVFDVPAEFIPVAIAWPLADGSQACLALP